ncbi:ubiquinone biosynthesis protein [Curtobacterium sp. MCBA15_009]|uniref:SAM-dependent methyltransferase n=1 Tax=Curtobacterium sp. MCBA15_009 TaxID=1898737 RepID=UPI0008DD683F|nr:SAM-dependent methyltransferase [Curtobacterium sp. MCBA15_009]OII11442.1 ubiquinone biosynthesis protein [Curtobacterium sp. MCBA15_009]
MTTPPDRSATDDRRRYRRTEPVFARAVSKALGDIGSLLELRWSQGDAAPSYAPTDRGIVTVVDAAAHLPSADGAFDAALATAPLPGPVDPGAVLAELRRVTRGPIVLFCVDRERAQEHWLAEYAPEVVAAAARRHPTPAEVGDALPGDTVTVVPLPIPFTCVDGFAEAYSARPERLLDAGVRHADPAWAQVDAFTARRSVAALRSALESGEWDRRHGALRISPTHRGSLLLVTATPTA